MTHNTEPKVKLGLFVNSVQTTVVLGPITDIV